MTLATNPLDHRTRLARSTDAPPLVNDSPALHASSALSAPATTPAAASSATATATTAAAAAVAAAAATVSDALVVRPCSSANACLRPVDTRRAFAAAAATAAASSSQLPSASASADAQDPADLSGESRPPFHVRLSTLPLSLLPALSRKRPASHMMDLDKHAPPSQVNHGTNTDPEDIEMHPPNHLALQAPQDDEMSTAQRLFDVTLESPSSPSAFKRMRSIADSDAGSSSCKDMDDPELLAPDSVPALLAQIRQLMDYVANKPTLQNGSASFVRDYLRTMLIQNSIAADEAIQAASKAHKADVVAGRCKSYECFKRIPDELAKHIFGFLDGHNLARAREVCRRWNEFACEEPLWKNLCLKRWRSLETDKELWKLIDKNIDPTGPNRWRLIYPKVNRSSQWNCRLQKTGRFICNLIAHQVSGAPLGDAGLPNILVVERRFNILHLQTFVLPDASILYFEPEAESDKSGFDDFIEYLNKRTRAGLALDDQRRFIFIPPCEYTRTQVEYQGRSLLGVVQNAYPPLAPAV